MTAALRRWTDLPSAQPEEDASFAQLAAAKTPTDADASIRSGAATPPLLAGAEVQPVLHFEAQCAPRCFPAGSGSEAAL
jgi:hypothetical protein